VGQWTPTYTRLSATPAATTNAAAPRRGSAPAATVAIARKFAACRLGSEPAFAAGASHRKVPGGNA
jgi:hypothetical protein